MRSFRWARAAPSIPAAIFVTLQGALLLTSTLAAQTSSKQGSNIAAAQLKPGCGSGSAKDCYRLGALRALGEGVRIDYAVAFRLFERACELGEVNGCRVAIAMHGGVFARAPFDGKRQLELVERACELGHGASCRWLGARGEWDDPRTFEYRKRACRERDANGCYDLSQAYTIGQGLRGNPSEQCARYERECDLGNARRCRALDVCSRLFTGMTGAMRDPDKARQAKERACELGHAWGCIEVDRHRRACQLGDATSCDSPADKARARALHRAEEECRTAVGACLTVAALKTESPPPSKTQTAKIQRECSAGSPSACSALGLLFVQGEVVKKDLRRATRFFQKACKGGSAEACVMFGTAYALSSGAVQVPERTSHAYLRACIGQNEEGCRLLGVSRVSTVSD